MCGGGRGCPRSRVVPSRSVHCNDEPRRCRLAARALLLRSRAPTVSVGSLRWANVRGTDASPESTFSPRSGIGPTLLQERSLGSPRKSFRVRVSWPESDVIGGVVEAVRSWLSM